jgi:hypothetical protein
MPAQEAFQFRKIILGITRLDGVPYFFSPYINWRVKRRVISERDSF